MCRCLRWLFNVAAWEPTQQEWLTAVQSIQVEELSRANRYVYKEDAKAAVIGRLMLREAIRQTLGCSWKSIRLERTDRGKPVLATPETNEPFGFNISHHGGLVVLATSCSEYCGVDTMTVDFPRGHTVASYLDLMKRNFSDRENSRLQKESTDAAKMRLFYRYWCLKESYIKAIGVGIHNDRLRDLDFEISQDLPCDGEPLLTTCLFLKEQPTHKEWLFEENCVDSISKSQAIATVCTKDNKERACKPKAFGQVGFQDLVALAERMISVDVEEFHNFQNKLTKK